MTHHGPHHGPHRGRRRGRCGPRIEWMSLDRQEWLARLEEHQRDLEQRTADVADLIRRLRDEPGRAESAPA